MSKVIRASKCVHLATLKYYVCTSVTNDESHVLPFFFDEDSHGFLHHGFLMNCSITIMASISGVMQILICYKSDILRDFGSDEHEQESLHFSPRMNVERIVLT